MRWIGTAVQVILQVRHSLFDRKILKFWCYFTPNLSDGCSLADTRTATVIWHGLH